MTDRLTRHTERLEALRKAGTASDIPGRERPENAQNVIIDLLEYMEAKEGFTLFQGKREKCAHFRTAKPDTVSRAPKRKT